MNKEYIEALKTIKIKCHPNSNPSPLVDEALKVVEKALQRLEQIDNAKPSEALESLEKYLFNEWKQNHVNFGCDYKLEAELDKQLNNLKSIKQYILKSQEQKKVLEIIKKKHVNMSKFKDVCIFEKGNELNKYNENLYIYDRITQEEFELLKRWLG